MMTRLHVMNDAVSDLIYVTYIFFSKLPIYIKEASTCEFFQKKQALKKYKIPLLLLSLVSYFQTTNPKILKI